ncbi:MAG: hypothetical protein ACOC0U_06465 [Desulfovibrionales bacterium]
MEGRLNAEVKIRARGASMAELMAGADGETLVSLSEGRIENQYLHLWGGNLGTQLFRLLDPTKETKATEMNCFVNAFTIRSVWPIAPHLSLTPPP